MLNTDEGYTPAYTLKGIAIQLLSFFDSETIAQVGTGANVELAKYRNSSTRNSADTKFHCSRCNFGKPVETNLSKAQSAVVMYENMALDCKKPLHRNRTRRNSVREQADRRNVDIFQKLIAMPQEIILLILDKLDTEELLALCGCDKIRELVTDYDLIRVRELQCFCSKRSFMEVKLGIGVHLGGGRKQGSFTSEFDLLSQEAFNKCNIRKSVQGLRFQHWMPLPISRRHWNLVRDDTDVVLTALARGARLGSRETKSNVLYHFMNDVVVKFSRTAKDCFESGYTQPTSSLTHPAEKAIESYFALFHLLLCLVVEDKKIVEDAHWMLEQFQRARLPNPTVQIWVTYWLLY